MMFQKTLFGAVLLIIFSCQNDSSSSQKEQLSFDESTPEGVVRSWQYHLDFNEFAAAKKLSTDKTIEFLNALEELVLTEEEPIPPDSTRFESIICKEKADSATCVYTILLEGDLLKDSFVLVKQQQQWLIDIQEEEPESEEFLEDMMDQWEN